VGLSCGIDASFRAGDAFILEPGEAHTFVSASREHRAFVLHVGGDGRDEVPVDRERLGP